MRITTVHWASRLTISHPQSLGLKTLCARSWGVTVLLFLLTMATSVQTISAQPTNFCTNCNGSTGNCATPAISANPNLTALCADMDIVFILDESGSVSGYEADVEAGVMGFLQALDGTGVRVSVIEFDALANTVNNYAVVNTSYIASMQGYFDGTPYNGQTYVPNGGTNWQDAMDEIYNQTRPDLIFFFTDGNPTGWTNGGSVDYCSNGSTTQQPEIVNPMKWANYYKDLGTHMFVLGVGTNINTQNLVNISNTNQWALGESVTDADWALETNFSDLADGLRDFALQICGTTVSVTKTSTPVCAGGTTTYTLTVTNTGAQNTGQDLTLRDTFPASLSSIACASNCANVCLAAVCNPDEPARTIRWNIGDLAPGASATITVTAVAAAAGSIFNRATVTGVNIDPTSGSNTLVVTADPTITIAVDDNSICDGGTSILTATITGGSGTNTIQWQHDFPTAGTTWVNEGGNVSPFTTPALGVGTHSYRALVNQSGNGCADDSPVLTITVSADPTVSVANSDPNICVGGSSTLSASPSGGIGTNSFQWQQFNGSTWDNISTTQNYSTGALNSAGTYTYRVIVTQNSSGCSVVSANAVVTVVNDPTVSVTASATSLCEGGTSLLTATVSGGTGTPVYQWQLFNGTTWDIVGVNQNTFTTPALAIGTYTYRVQVTQNTGCSVTSANQILTVVADPTVTVAISESTICSGGTALLTASISGGTGTPSYQWQFNTTGTTWTNVGSNQNTYTTPILTTPGNYRYRVLITQATGCSAQSANADVTVVADPTVNVTSTATSICDGGTTTFTAAVSGGAGTPVYQWQFNNSGNWTNVGTNFQEYTTPLLTPGTYTYRLIVTQATGCSVQSANLTVTVVADPTLTMSINNPTLCIGGDATLTATVNGGTGTITYLWQQFIASAWSTVGTNQNTYTTPTLTADGTYTYRVIVTRNTGCQVISANQVVTVVPDPIITAEPVGFVECVGETDPLTVTVSSQTGTITYQWQVGSTSTGPWTNVGTNSNTYVPPSGTIQTYYYRVLITNSAAGCNALTSSVATVVVTGAALVSISVNNPVICVGGSSVISSTVTNGSGTYTYVWQRSPAGLNTWSTAPSPYINPTYTPSSGTPATFDYRVLVQDVLWDCGDPVSNVVNVTVQSQPTIFANTDDAFICIGGSALLTSTPGGGSGNFTYRWQYSLTGGNPWINLSGGTTQNFTVPGSAVGTISYRVLLTDNANSCTDPISNTISVTVIDQPTVSVSTLTPVICLDGTFLITSTVNNGSGIYAYQWQIADNETGPWSNITVNGGFSDYTDYLTTPGVRYYRVLVNDLANGCGQMTSSAISITVNPNPTVLVTPAGQVLCVGGNAPLTAQVTNGSGDFSYQWEVSPDGSSWQNVASGGNAVVYNPPTGEVASYYYRVLLTDNASGCSNPYSEPVYIVTQAQAIVDVSVNNPVICIGGSSTISSTVTYGSGTFTYQWQQSGNGTSGWANVSSNGTNPAYNVPSGVASSNWYRVIVTDVGNGCNDPVSSTTQVIVQSPPSVTVAATNPIICIGGSSNVNSTVLNGSGFYTYQWQSSTNGAGGPWSNITNQGNGANYAAPASVAGTTHYRVIVTDAGSGCGSALSNAVSVQVVGQPTISIAANNEVICIGGTSTISTTITNGSGSYAFQWQSSPTGSAPWTTTGGNTSSLVITGTATGTTYYRVQLDDLANGCANPLSSNVSIVVQSGASVIVNANQDSVCLYGPVELSASVTNGSGFYGYQWQSSTTGAGGPWINMPGETYEVLAPSTSTAGVTWYRVMITDFGSGCGDPVSGATRIVVFGQPEITINLPVPVVCVGGVALITSTVVNGSGVFAYQWQESPDGVVWTDIATNGTSANYSVPTTATLSRFYRVILTDLVSDCNDPESNAIQVYVVSPASVRSLHQMIQYVLVQ